MGVATRLVASTPTQADAIRWGGVTSMGTGAAAISSDRHSNRIQHGPTHKLVWARKQHSFLPELSKRSITF